MATLEAHIGYVFRDAALLTLALTHPSTAAERNNQRLEFLGDAVLGILVTRILYDMFPDEQEGALARRRAALVCGATLAQVARDIGLGDHLLMGTSEQQIDGQENNSNLEDALEALIGALYLDGGMSAAETFVLPRWTQLAQNISEPPKDAKTSLQEWAQGQGLPLPLYQVVETTGPAHAPIFTIEVTVQGHAPARATAPSKKAAEQSAAQKFLADLRG